MAIRICKICGEEGTVNFPPEGWYCSEHKPGEVKSLKMVIPSVSKEETRTYTMSHLKELKEKIFLPETEFKELSDFAGGYYFCVYHPVSKKQFGHRSDLIRHIKNKENPAIEDMINRLKKNLTRKGQFTLVVVPSHNASINDSGIKRVAKGLCNGDWIDGTDCIKRKYIMPARHGISGRGYTNEEIAKEKDSLSIENEELIKNKDILLFDDITTTRVSLVAAMQSLYPKHPRSIICLVLGKTDESRTF